MPSPRKCEVFCEAYIPGSKYSVGFFVECANLLRWLFSRSRGIPFRIRNSPGKSLKKVPRNSKIVPRNLEIVPRLFSKPKLQFKEEKNLRTIYKSERNSLGLFINLEKIPGAIYKFLGAGGSEQISENSRRSLVEVWLALVDLLGWPPDGWPKYVSVILLWNGSKTRVHDKIHTSRLAQKGYIGALMSRSPYVSESYILSSQDTRCGLVPGTSSVPRIGASNAVCSTGSVLEFAATVLIENPVERDVP